jgi:hypothetical protein
MKPVARIELYVPERAVARHEAKFQQWVETVTAPLRYVCKENSCGTRWCDVGLGEYINHFGDKEKGGPDREAMSAFSGFSMARDQRGVWFREHSGTPEEDRVTIYTFLVDRALGEVAYFAIRERLAKTILRERNEEAVLLSGLLKTECGPQMEFVYDKQIDYLDFAKSFECAANVIASPNTDGIDCPKNRRIELAWKLLHLFQLLQRDLMASTAIMSDQAAAKVVYEALFHSFRRIVAGVFSGEVLSRMSPSVLATWVKIAEKLTDQQFVNQNAPHIQKALGASILEIADSLWRFQGHSFAGAGDLDCDSCGVEAFAFVAGLKTWLKMLPPSIKQPSGKHQEALPRLWTDAECLPHLLLRDWRGLSYCLKVRSEKEAGKEAEKELAAAFGLRTVDAIVKSGISDERTWYQTMKDVFPTR